MEQSFRTNLAFKSNLVALAGFLTCVTLILGLASNLAAQTVPTMTIQIYNDSDIYSIYPVLSTGAHSVADTWMQAAFKIPKAQLANYPYPTPNTFRLYFNPTGTGIPPHTSVTITLPLYTQLVPDGQIDPKSPDQYIDWWNGGRVSIYESLFASGAPPSALAADYKTRSSQTLVTPVAGAAVPTCPACEQPLEIYKDSGGELPSNDPDQLTEYTLGAINLSKDPYTLDVRNVDYDVSYVDNAYLPAAMEPYNNPIVGYVGTTEEIDPFKDALRKFLGQEPLGGRRRLKVRREQKARRGYGGAESFAGWPQYVDNERETILKIPSALHIMLDQANLTPAPPWMPVENMKTLWRGCTTGGSEPICDKIRDVNNLFQANYAKYVSNYHTTFKTTCNQAMDPDPATLTEDSLLAHVYGWGPFNANCSAQTNLLENTTGYIENNSLPYQTVKADYDALQYWPTGEFDPYVTLIHGKDYLGADYVYAYSVDDAVGNMQTTGEGLIIAVGGSDGLPNPRPATAPIHVPFGWSAKDAVRFLEYGICTTTPNQNVNPDFPSFDLSTNQLSDCTLSFVDNQNPPNKYYFKINAEPPYPPIPPAGQPIPDINKTMIDCSGNTQVITDTWCKNIFGYTQKVIAQHKQEDTYISVPAPAQPPPKNPASP